MQLTLADLRARVLARVDGNSLLFPNTEIDQTINESIQILNLFTGFQQISLIIPHQTQAGRFWYDIPNEIVLPLRVKIGNTYLQPSSILNIGRANPQWIQETTSNINSPVASWIRFGFRKLAIHPADATGGADITVTGIKEPKKLVASTDTINFSNDILSAFDLYSAHVLLLKESPREFAMGSTMYQEFMRQMKKISIWKSFVSPRYFLNEASQPLNR